MQLRTHAINVESPINVELINGLLELCNLSNALHPMILGEPKVIWKVRIGIALAVMQEEYGIISLVANLIWVMKQIEIKDIPNLQQFISNSINKFSGIYSQSSKFFNTLKLIPDLAENKDKLYSLPLGLDIYLRNTKFVGNSTNSIQDFLQPTRDLLGLHVPKCIRHWQASAIQKFDSETESNIPKPTEESEETHTEMRSNTVHGSNIFKNAQDNFCFESNMNSAISRVKLVANNSQIGRSFLEEPVSNHFLSPIQNPPPENFVEEEKYYKPY